MYVIPDKKLIKINTSDRQLMEQNIGLIASMLNNDKVIILPAKTMYGISARFDSEKAAEKIHNMKDRPAEMPFIILISGKETLDMLTAGLVKNSKILTDFFWDEEDVKPLTIIFKKNPELKKLADRKRDTIAVRMAEFDYVRQIIDKSAPVISTSANISGTGKIPLEICHIPDKILKNADMVIEHENKLLGIQSTIIDMSDDADFPKLVRQGAVPFDDILQKL
jgi:L-threonylcarbamoyladenylate synthase